VFTVKTLVRSSPRSKTPALALLLAVAAVAAIALAATPAASAKPRANSASPTSVFGADGMWIWYVKASSGGKPGKIAKRARRSGIETIYVKAGDGSTPWNQFSSSLVARLHAGGRKVCAWQFVYGRSPSTEARIGAAAVAKGADCLVIDAEGGYEGRYSSADVYMTALRSAIGAEFPVAISSFPYVHYHPGFPYSVFMRPGDGAQYNLPQLYWKSIGTTLTTGFSTTYRHNNLYERPIQPVGQTYLNPAPKKLKRFRRFARSYGSTGTSWWSWQETSKKEWRAIRKGNRPLGFRGQPGYPLLRVGSRGDLVVWAQEHLVAAGYPAPIDGSFGSTTGTQVTAFQANRGLPQSGQIDDATWVALLDYVPATVHWGAGSASRAASASGAAATPASAPASASDPAVRYEIRPGPRP
jgi:hypothetical protein